MIHLTQAAANEIRRLQLSRQLSAHHFRLGVKPGGCSGLYYTLELSETLPQSDRHFESQGISLIIDNESYPYLKNLKLDYAEDLMGGGFRFNNPNASTSCSCGQSFSSAI